ncbi:MAG: PAS domain S-box protein, partial [Frankiales bacterium]|nr:PAS domain S-box protein [Frankiales bacterium]
MRIFRPHYGAGLDAPWSYPLAFLLPTDGVPLVRDATADPLLVVLVGAALDGTITHWSAGAREVYGWTEQEILGRHLSTLAAAGDAHGFEERAELLAGGEPGPLGARFATRTGEHFSAGVSLALLREDGGRVVGTLARHHDAGKAAADSERRAGFEDSLVPQSRIDLTGRVLAVNTAMERALGESAAELVGQDALARYVPADRAGLEQALAQLAAG